MKKTKKIILIIAIIALVITAITACVNNTQPNTTKKDAIQQTKAPVNIGVMLPLTGDISFLGNNARYALEMGAQEINNNGGINNRPIKLIFEDGKCNAKEASAAAQKLVNIDKVTAIIGGLCSAETLAAAPIAEGKAVLISPGSSNPAITDAGDYIFRDYPSDTYQGKKAAEFAYNNLGARKAAIIYEQNDWAVGLKNKFEERFKELGGKITITEAFEQGSKDLRTQLLKLQNTEQDLVYFLAYTDSSIVGFQQKQELGITETFLGGETWADISIAEKAGKAADGAIHLEVFHPANKEFETKLKAYNPEAELTTATPQSYDALMILVEAIRKTGTNPENIKNELYKIDYQGISGRIAFDENGDLKEAKYSVLEYQNGKSIEYQG